MLSQSYRSSALLSVLLASAVALPSSLRAQQRVAADVSTIAQTPAGLSHTTVRPAVPVPAAPRIAPAGISRTETSPAGFGLESNAPAQVNAGSNLALMGVGAAGLVIGLLIGGDGGTILALSGGVLGLVGLYHYLR